MSGLNTDSPFPGTRWFGTARSSPRGAFDGTAASPAFAELANEIPPSCHPAESNAVRWPLAALIDGDWSYFRRDGEPQELLFNLRDDASELHNRADDPAMAPTVKRLPAALGRLTGGRLTPDRFNR